ncbi:MAG: family 43 glycosylhydrolase [Polyangiaceae bacterium]
MPRRVPLSVASLILLSACSGKFGSESNAGGSVGYGGETFAGSSLGGGAAVGGSRAEGGVAGLGGLGTSSSSVESGGTSSTGGVTSASGGLGSGGTVSLGGTMGRGGASVTGGSTAAGGSSCSGPIGTFTGALADGINFVDTAGNRVNAHGGGIIKEGDTFYMHGEYFEPNTTDNNFKGFTMYSSKNMSTWKYEGIILPKQASGELGPNRKGERPHIVKCPATGEFVLYAHAASADYQTDKEVVYATSSTVNGQYTYRGPLKNASGTLANHSDMGTFVDGDKAYVIAESGNVYTLATDCHSWVSRATYSAVNGDSGGVESPAVFKANGTYYWVGSYKTGWRANNNFYSTAPAMTGPWTYQGFIAPVTTSTTTTDPRLFDERTWLSQSTWVQPVAGCNGTTYVYWGDHWYGNLDATAQGKYNALATYVFQPLVFTGTKIFMPTYLATWKLDVGAGTWSL